VVRFRPNLVIIFASFYFKAGFAQSESNNPWRLAETASMKAEAAKLGWQLVYTDAASSSAKQVSDVEDLIARRVNLILLAPREFEGLAPALQAAKRANIPVILVDREAAGTAGVDFVTFLGSNFVEQGRRAADWLARATGGHPDDQGVGRGDRGGVGADGDRCQRAGPLGCLLREMRSRPAIDCSSAPGAS